MSTPMQPDEPFRVSMSEAFAAVREDILMEEATASAQMAIEGDQRRHVRHDGFEGVHCCGCGLDPMDTHAMFVKGYEAVTPVEALAYVMNEEGTFNHGTGHYWCDGCYIKAGMPLGLAP